MKSSPQRLGYTTTKYSVGKGQTGGQAPPVNWSEGAFHSRRGLWWPAGLIGGNPVFCCSYICCLADWVVCGGLVWKFHVLESDEEALLSFFSPYGCKVLWASWTCGTWEAGVDRVHTRAWLHFPHLSANNLLRIFSTCSYLIQGFLKGSYTTASLWWTMTYKATLGSFVQHFRINCVCTAKPENPTLLSLCFFENLPGSCLKVGVLFTSFSFQIQKAILQWTFNDIFCFQGDV